MWLTTIHGFYSITRAPRGVFQIRARNRQHLTRLVKATWDIWDDHQPEVVETRGSDYRYRIFASDAEVSRILVILLSEVDYGNFKDAAKAAAPHDEAYQRFLMNTWWAGTRMQPGGAYGEFDIFGDAPKPKPRRTPREPDGLPARTPFMAGMEPERKHHKR